MEICGYRLPGGLKCERVLISEDEKYFGICEICVDRTADEFRANQEFRYYHPISD